ncbi:MAG: hypothetical protein J4F46_01505 [Dehalococcoidia bacterium]|nr:hypothetical protein [Dehalococcoidia bacterium]
MRDRRSQDEYVPGKWVRRFPILAALKSFANGVNPKYGTKTVVVSKITGNIVWLEDKSGNIIGPDYSGKTGLRSK